MQHIGANRPAEILLESQLERLPGLDGFRAIAVLLVLIDHYCPKHLRNDPFGKFVPWGIFGVDIFFVLSGFLITHLLLREEQNEGHVDLQNFYIRRVIRILPPLVVYLTCLAVANLVGLVEVPTIDFLAGLLFFRNYAGKSVETAHFWTLGIEEQFYLLWPILFVFVRHPRSRILITASAVFLSPFWRQWNYQVAGGPMNVNSARFDLRSDPIAVGALLAILLSIPSMKAFLVWRPVRGSWSVVIALTFLSIMFYTKISDIRLLRAFVPTLNYLAIATLINCAIHDRRSKWAAFLGMRPLAWIGTLSYSIYLWQEPFAPHIPGSHPAGFREFPGNLLMAFCSAMLCYHLIERPLSSVRQRLRRRSSIQGPVSSYSQAS